MASMWAACCCSDTRGDRNQLTFTYSTTDEAPGGGVKPISSDNKHAIAGGVASTTLAPPSQRSNAPPPLALQSPHSDNGSTARSLTAEEKEVEKARLQTLVNTFAKRAVRGCPCQYVKEGFSDRITTQYRIDKSLEHLLIVSASDPQSPEITCPISAIQDIYSLVEDGESCFPPEIISSLTPQEKEMLLMVVYRSGADKMFRFCLLEESRDSRDVFLECLRILCIYAQSAPSAP